MGEHLLQKLERDWLQFTPSVLDSLDTWTSGRGMLFISEDTSAEQAAQALAGHIADSVLAYRGEKSGDWHKGIDSLTSGHVPGGLLKNDPPKFCVLLRQLESTPRWLWRELDGLLCHPPPGCTVIAATRDITRIPVRLVNLFLRMTMRQTQGPESE